MSRAPKAAKQAAAEAGAQEDTLSDAAPRDSHWHYTMVQARVAGLFDVRALLSVAFCFVNFFSWWDLKLIVVAVTIVVSTLLEMRRITLDVALRQVKAIIRGPNVPGIATRSQTYLGYRPRPALQSPGGHTPRARRDQPNLSQRASR